MLRRLESSIIVYAQSAASTTYFTAVAGAGHGAASLGSLSGADGSAAVAFPSVLETGEGEAGVGAEVEARRDGHG
jgi:hypothetical protein